MIAIYTITNTINGKMYVGQTADSPASRWSKHKYCARKGAGGSTKLRNAMRKYGIEVFRFEVVCVVDTPEAADASEAELIAVFDLQNSRFGYNITPGGGAETARAASRIAVEQMRCNPQRAEQQRDIMRNAAAFRDMAAHRDRLIARNKSRARLNPDNVRDIRASDETYAVLAERYNATVWSIYDIKHKRTWAHVA